MYNKYYFLLIFIFFQPDGRKLLKNRKRLNVDTVNVDQVNVDPVSGSHVDKVADVERESTVISQLMNPKSSKNPRPSEIRRHPTGKENVQFFKDITNTSSKPKGRNLVQKVYATETQDVVARSTQKNKDKKKKKKLFDVKDMTKVDALFICKSFYELGRKEEFTRRIREGACKYFNIPIEIQYWYWVKHF